MDLGILEPQNAVRVFVFNPLYIHIVSKLLKVDYRKYCDYNAFPAMVWYGLGHFSCLATNCCHGFAYYIMLILYGSQRFVAEFFRNNYKLIVFTEMSSASGVIGISNLALWALAMFVEGVIILTIMVRRDRKQRQEELL